MNADGFAIVVRFALAMCVLYAVFNLFFKPVMIATFRQDLFGLRRELFLMAHDSSIDYSHPGYVRLRMTINGSLRFAERMTLVRFIWTLATLRKVNWTDNYGSLIASLSEPTRASLLSIRMKLNLIVLKHMIAISPLAWVLLGAILIAELIRLPIRMFIQAIEAKAASVTEMLSTGDTLPDCAVAA